MELQFQVAQRRLPAKVLNALHVKSLAKSICYLYREPGSPLFWTSSVTMNGAPTPNTDHMEARPQSTARHNGRQTGARGNAKQITRLLTGT